MFSRLSLRPRFLAAGIHLLLSFAVAGLAAILVFGLWYPGPFRLLAGGRELFLLVTAVDVVIGPVLTFVIFDRRKGARHLRRDLAVIGVLQLAALGYGLHTVYAARPIAMVFEVDRFQMVTASNVATEDLPTAAPAYRKLPLTGPLLLGTRRPNAGEERNDALWKGAAGIDIGSRPLFWQPYEQSRADALARSRPLTYLFDRYPKESAGWRERLAAMRADPATARFLPVVARGDWVAVLDSAGHVLGYLPVDGFL